jgi:hypothetical protein
MQIEKHIKIVPTPTGAVVFFAGQVCLNVGEHSGRYTWSISPVFARLTTGISNCFQVPMCSWDGQATLAEAIADGLTKLDEMQAFYGVIDMPEDTYVGEHLSEEVDLEDEFQELTESFVVRQVGQSRNHPPRIMISAAAVINRAREMAKEAGEKTHGKFIKLAHAEIASDMKAESVQYEDAVADALASIKEDCRIEALSMSDSLLAAQQLANELFEDIVQEYLDEALIGRMSDMSKYTHPDIENSKPFNYAEWKASGVKPRKPRGYKEAEAIGAAQRKIDQTRKTNEEVEELDEATHQELLDGAQKAYIEATRKGNGVMAKHYGQEILKHKANIARAKKLKLKEEVEELDEMEGAPYTLGGKVDKNKVYKVHRQAHNGSMEHNPDDTYHSLHDAKRVAANMGKSGSKTKITIHDRTKLAGPIGKLPESVEDLDEAALSGDAYWKAKEAESKEEFLKAQRKALGLPEPVKRGRGKPTLIDRDLLKTRAHSNVEAGKRPTAGFDRNEKIHFVRHLKNHPDFADKHVSQAGRPVGTTKVAKEQKDLAKKKQDSAFSMWAGLGKRS